jgi:hypothetical protein
MARLARVIAVGVPHHITQRGTHGALSSRRKRIEKSISICYGKAREKAGRNVTAFTLDGLLALRWAFLREIRSK